MVQVNTVWKQLGIPLLVLGAGCLLFFALFTDVHFDADRPHNPVTWPSMMTTALMVVASIMLLWNLRRIWKYRQSSLDRQTDAGDAPFASDEIIGKGLVAITASEGGAAGGHDNRKMVLGFFGIVGYGFAITYIGFAFGTFFVIVYWLLIGGQRRFLPIILTSSIATLAFLYIFLKLAYMPLPKGVGIFHDLTIELYRALGLF